jgi:hypothetical protein
MRRITNLFVCSLMAIVAMAGAEKMSPEELLDLAQQTLLSFNKPFCPRYAKRI